MPLPQGPHGPGVKSEFHNKGMGFYPGAEPRKRIRSEMKKAIVVVGGGLSGLYAARLLAAAGRDFVLLEARDRLGGRILSAAAERGGFDLGPSWFWPGMQPMMVKLVEELGLTAFAQHADGDVVVERSAAEPAQRFRSPWETAPSFRIAGDAGIPAACASRPTRRSISAGCASWSTTRSSRTGCGPWAMT